MAEPRDHRQVSLRAAEPQRVHLAGPAAPSWPGLRPSRSFDPESSSFALSFPELVSEARNHDVPTDTCPQR